MKPLFILFFSILAMNLQAQQLKTHQWEHRILVIKSKEKTAEVLDAQHKEFVDAAKDLKERKFIIYTITGNEFRAVDYKNNGKQHRGTTTVDLKKMLNSTSDFEVLLIGLDGNVKLRQITILTKEQLFRTVDAMPMRRREIRNTEN